ncbi:Uncharacterised protein [Mycobacteroides abscessus subsp. abscessus]|nr:Uncharacterised protein [Mycobacteroides abscessus subsp. abscessus]
MGALVLGDVEAAHVLFAQAQAEEPVPAVLDPFVEEGWSVVGVDEVLELHLLELTGAEDEVAGRDLVAEGLADLPDSERRLLP